MLFRSRKASEGLVGVAKRDGEWCAEVVTRYLEAKNPGQPVSSKVVTEKLTGLLKERKSRPVNLAGLKALDAAEKAHSGATDCIGEFKYATNQEMLDLIDRHSR